MGFYTVFDVASPRRRKPKTQRTRAPYRHPDRIFDQVSDAVLDACLTSDPKCKVACETCVKDNMVMVAGVVEENTKGPIPEVFVVADLLFVS